MNRSFVFLFALVASSVFVAGCGGGGHSSPGSSLSKGTGVLSVTLDGDAGAADGPSGTTQTVVIYRTDGTEVDKQAVNLSSGTKQISFTGIPAGTMRLHVGLRATSGGAEIGAVDTTFAGDSAAAPVTVKMKHAVTSVVLSSSATAVNVGAVAPLYAAARADDGSYVFTAAGGWSWTSSSPANASVDGTGKVTGVAVGNATITATHLSSGVSAAAAATILSNSVYQGKWTVMVYMDAANSLWSYAYDNINQMERIANNPNVRFVIQWKQVKGLDGDNPNPLFSGTRRYLAAYDTTSTIGSTLVQDLGSGVDMASSAGLRDFVTWTKAKYPADHYALVLWSHGGGWYSTKVATNAPKRRAIIYDDETGNYLDLPDVRNALDAGSLDILAYDACLMQGAESLLEFSDRTNVIVGTEDDTPGPGYPYNLMFAPIVTAPDTTATALATSMVSTFVNYYKDDSTDATWPIQMSALDTSKASSVATALDGLGSALLNGGSSVAATVRSTVRPGCARIEPDDGYYYYDLDQVATTFAAQTSLSSGIRTAASALDQAIQGAVIATAGGEGVTAAPAYHGLSIDFSPSSQIDSTTDGYATSYNKLQLSTLTHWNEFLESAAVNP